MRIAVLDIGGTSIKSALWDGTELGAVQETDTEASCGGEAVVGKAARILRTYGAFDAIGVSTAGQVNTDDGSIHYANQNIPGYTGVRLREILEREFGVPAAVENDVNAAALGELYFGAARGVRDFLCLTYGTGVGGAIVTDGKILHGNAWSGGSFGAMLIHPEQRVKGVELSGCYERCASTTALVQAACRIDRSLTDGRKIFAAFDRPEIRSVIDDWIGEIVFGLVTLIHVFDPPLVVLGGGILAQPYVAGEIRRRTMDMIESNFRAVALRQAVLGNRAGLMGSVALHLMKSNLAE